MEDWDSEATELENQNCEKWLNYEKVPYYQLSLFMYLFQIKDLQK